MVALPVLDSVIGEILPRGKQRRDHGADARMAGARAAVLSVFLVSIAREVWKERLAWALVGWTRCLLGAQI